MRERIDDALLDDAIAGLRVVSPNDAPTTDAQLLADLLTGGRTPAAGGRSWMVGRVARRRVAWVPVAAAALGGVSLSLLGLPGTDRGVTPAAASFTQRALAALDASGGVLHVRIRFENPQRDQLSECWADGNARWTSRTLFANEGFSVGISEIGSRQIAPNVVEKQRWGREQYSTAEASWVEEERRTDRASIADLERYGDDGACGTSYTLAAALRDGRATDLGEVVYDGRQVHLVAFTQPPTDDGWVERSVAAFDPVTAAPIWSRQGTWPFDQQSDPGVVRYEAFGVLPRTPENLASTAFHGTMDDAAVRALTALPLGVEKYFGALVDVRPTLTRRTLVAGQRIRVNCGTGCAMWVDISVGYRPRRRILARVHVPAGSGERTIRLAVPRRVVRRLGHQAVVRLRVRTVGAAQSTTLAFTLDR